jgi:hypothetical protein
MDRTRTASAGVGTAGAFDASAEAALPVHVDDRTPAVSGKARAKRSWLGIAVRIVRDAAVAVAFMTLVPIAIVAIYGDNAWGRGNFGNDVRASLALSEVYRPLALPKDPSIMPMQAGLAFNALQLVRIPSAFLVIETPRPAHSWEAASLTEDMFVSGKMTWGFRGPSSSSILEAVSRGFTPQETAYLRTLATAPVWRTFDLVARAPAVDIVGGEFKLPFPADASSDRMPTSYKTIKELAYAAVSRAAYHLSIGQRDSAEAALRSIVSVGYVLMDDGHTAMDQVIGNITIAIGRDALARLYVITKDPRATSPSLARPGKVSGGSRGARLPVNQMRKFLIAEAGNPQEHLGIRYEALRLLSTSSCTNVKELMFGNGADVDAAIESARTNLARYPSERALVDLVTQLQQPRADELKYNPISALAISGATVAGAVLHNPRLAACTRIVTGYYGGPW